MAKKLNSIYVSKELIKRALYIFSPFEFQRVFAVSPSASSSFLFEHTKDNLFVKLRNSLYALLDKIPSELEIANRLYKPSYISFEYALSFYHIIPETVYVITSATTKATREFDVMNKLFTYSRIKEKYFFGYSPNKISNTTVLIAEPEKAFLDYLYFVILKKKTLNERLDLTKFSKKKLFKQLRRFNNRKMEMALKGLLRI